MALTPTITDAACNAAADAVVDLVDAGSPPGKLRIYDGTPPADAGTALSGNNVLADLPMSNPAFGSAASRVATANAITTDSSADNTGTATFFRILNAANTAIIQGSVATSGGDLNLSSTSIVAGGSVAVSSFTYTQSKN